MTDVSGEVPVADVATFKGVGMGLLSLQLVAFGRHDCLVPDVLLPGLLCPLFLGCLFDLLPLLGLSN